MGDYDAICEYHGPVSGFISLNVNDFSWKGNIRFDVFAWDKEKDKKIMASFWLNSFLLETDDGKITLAKPEIDKAQKDKKDKKFPADFKVTLELRRQILGRQQVFRLGSDAVPSLPTTTNPSS